ncbi:MAG: protein translocase subunit SecD [Agathobacter sp.]|nr:protein translocase subunit SecD [Agathobacter sp.]
MKKSKGALILVLILACLAGLGYYATTIITATGAGLKSSQSGEESTSNGIKLGLDLSGGVSITYKIVDENPSQEDVNDTVAKLEERAESYTTEYSVYPVGDDRITVEIPGVYDANEVLEDLGSPGSLYFIVETNDAGEANYTTDYTTGSVVLNYTIDELIASGDVILTGNDVKVAEASYQGNSTLNTNEPVVQLQLTDEAAAVFAEATEAAEAAGETIGIYYDDHFISVPSVDEKISDGNCVINGMSSFEEAEELATFIRVGAINLELEELESSVVGAQLGNQAVITSLKAALIGLVLVMIFMIIWYGVPGVAASVALAIYSTIVVAFIYLFEVTLTLPGIAGVILGIGMAVDANVITFARIREEIAAGKSVSVAINEGYKKALSAILDGNVTTFIATIVLMVLGSGTVKGFAYTLMISIVVSMFTALIVTRFLLKSLYALGLKDQKFYGKAKERKPIDFMKHKVIYFVISLAIIAAGVVGMIGYSASGKGAFNFSLEFVGGTSTTAEFDKAYTIDEIETQIVPEISEVTGDSAIQATTVDGTNQIVFKTRNLSLEERTELETVLTEKFGVEASSINTTNIGSTISGEMRSNAVVAVIVACIFMLLYIWFRFKDIRFASSAIAALVHDVLIVLTAYALLRISVGSNFIACILTIVGYSINDTIVIFDRIRENMHGNAKHTKEELAEIANRSLTQTLSRSINTSITTFIMVLLLFILGVASIREFSLPLMVGLVAGSYSSIFIATELWYIMKLYVGKNRLIKKSEAKAAKKETKKL